jgi:hypothetical protein
MIYVLEEDDPRKRALWVTYTQDCIEWRVKMLQRIEYRSPPAAQQEQRVKTLETHVRLPSPPQRTEEYWTDALVLWRRQPASVQAVILKSISAKFSAVPQALGLVDMPRRSVFLPNTAQVLANAVADVARDTNIIFTFRTNNLGENAPLTVEALAWRVAAYSLAALLNRVQDLLRESRMEVTWSPARLKAEPDLPDLELVPSLY